MSRRIRGLLRPHTPDPTPEKPSIPEKPGLWSDELGRLATRGLQLIILVIILAGLVFSLQTLLVVFIPVLLALIFASAFAPVTRFLRGKNVPPALIALICLLGTVLIFVGLGWLVVNAVRNQWEEISSQAQEGFDELMTWVNTLPIAPSQDQIDSAIAAVRDFVTSAQFGSGALAGVGAVANFATGAVLLIVVLFFFLKDGPRIWEFLLRPFHGENEERARRVGTKTVTTLGAYVRGTATVALVDAIGIGLGLFIIGVPLALPLAVMVFFLAFIPLVGATLAGILAALVALVSNGFWAAIAVVAVVIGVNQLEGNLLQPVVMGRTLQLHALVVLIALTAGTVMAGILGAVLAVPITAVLWGIVKIWDGEDTPAKWARPKQQVPDSPV